MTAPIGLRVGWEFLTPIQYATVLFVGFCGLGRKIEEELLFAPIHLNSHVATTVH
jgi:hypothetical protein